MPQVPARLQLGLAVLLLGALVVTLGYVIGYLSKVVIPIAMASLLAAMLAPVARRLQKWALHRAVSAGLTPLGGLILITGA